MVLRIKHCKIIALILLIFTLSPSSFAKKETMFEGYYKILSGGVHVGFVIQRYSFDSKKKQFHTTYYIKTNPLAGNMAESLKAIANDKFEPISYQYTSKIQNKVTAIDATFAKSKMNLTVSDGKKNRTLSKDLPKGTFLSSFLGYMMLSRGLAKGKVYNYYGIAEEQGNALAGKVLVKEEITVQGIPSWKLYNEYGGTRYISTITKKGEVLNTKSPVQAIETQLVKVPSEATKGFALNSKTLRLLFGNIPKGKINELVKSTTPPTVLPDKINPPKTDNKKKGS